MEERCMTGVIAILTGEAYQHARQVQRWMEEAHGVTQPALYQPHLTFTIGNERCSRKTLIQGLTALAHEIDPFEIVTMGVGIFPPPMPVIYLPVPRIPELTAAYRAISQLFVDAGVGNRPYYRPENWLPHVTLASQDLTPKLIAAMIEGILANPLRLTSRVANLILVEEVEKDRWVTVCEFPLRGENMLPANPHGLTDRPCQPSDRLFVYGLVEETLKPLVTAFYSWAPARFEENWDATWRRKRIVLAECRPVGFYQVEHSPDGHLYIGNLFFAPAVHGRGWGGWLLGHLEAQAEGRPVRLHVWENNPAVAFYLHHDYRIVETVGHKHLMEKG